MDLTDPAARQRALAAISPEDAQQEHELLRSILAAEVDHRRRVDDEYYENLYWCGYLLSRVGDPSDVPAMWAAKHINMDTGAGFDTQSMFGAGVPETLAYLRTHGHSDIADALSQFDLRELDGWAESIRSYYYS